MKVEAELDLKGFVERLEAKFMRLLETERDTAEFEQLFREVDEELGIVAGAAPWNFDQPS